MTPITTPLAGASQNGPTARQRVVVVKSPLVEQFKSGGVPTELRLLAASGALPLATDDLVELLVELTEDANEGVSGSARATLAATSQEDLLPILSNRATPGRVLSWAVRKRAERELREVVLQNASLPDEVVEAVAGGLPEDLVELVVINHQRLIQRPGLLEAVEANPHLNNDQRRRLREFRAEFRKDSVAEVRVEPQPQPAPLPVVEPEPEPEPVLAEGEALARYLSDDERNQTEKVSAVQRLYRLSTPEKLITALKGTREERAILIRDPNRLVAAAVLSSPKLTEAEIEAFSAMKSVSEFVLREIGGRREWTKRYPIAYNLVRNPRTPLEVALPLVSGLTQRDLRALAVDKNVSEAVRRAAQRFLRGPQGRPE